MPRPVYAVDWLRELLNAFASQDDPHMRAKCLKRLAQLGWSTVALDRCLGAAPRFRLLGDALGAADAPRGAAARRSRAAAAAAAVVGGEGGSRRRRRRRHKSAKKQKRNGSDVDTTDDEGAATDAEADDGPPGGTAGADGADARRRHER